MMIFRTLLFIILVSSCGNTPFDEDYWGDNINDQEREEEASGAASYTANLAPVSSLGLGSGDARIDLSGNSVSLRVEMQDVPQNIVQTQVLVTNTRCSSIAGASPTTGTTETRDFTYTDNTAIAALYQEGRVNSLNGLSLVIYGMVRGTVTVPSTGTFPLACGPLSLIGGTVIGGTPGETTFESASGALDQ
jgi:hypothetical protein